MRPAADADLAALLKRNPRLLRVLDRYGIHVCAGCLLTLTSPIERAAAYHGVPNIPALLRELRLKRRGRATRKHGPRRGR